MSKDRGSTIVVARGQEVHLLATQSRKIVQTFNTHKTAVKSISLSNDGTLLASVSSNAVHVHNLSLASHTVLRGLPVGNTISTCAFHPHSRTRLLLGSGTQFIIYDTTRPSGPSKTIAIDKDKSNPGSIVAIACSPFSKTLVSVACSGGMIGLVDLEKEKGLFKTLALPVPLTSLTFSPEGATIYVGTENGKLLVLDLRSLDKPPKSINVSDNGDKVISLCVQLKSGETASKASTIAATKPLVQRDVNKNLARRTAADTVPEKNIATAAVKSRVGSIMSTVLSTGTPAKARLVSGTPRRTQARTASAYPFKRGNEAEPAKKPFSPPKSPLVKRADIADDQEFDLSVRIENLLAFPRTKENTSPPEATTGRAAPPSLSTAAGSIGARP
ncbi:Protein NEDD1 [Grifola frondosa]|uniref:Protein NEDD1 n=1 Tax=Grifola frondosa TaxID=5627 RepID=A0A1C7LX63_GRIFR|nr:Protein NEDD1 [Grifola frondosa]